MFSMLAEGVEVYFRSFWVEKGEEGEVSDSNSLLRSKNEGCEALHL